MERNQARGEGTNSSLHENSGTKSLLMMLYVTVQESARSKHTHLKVCGLKTHMPPGRLSMIYNIIKPPNTQLELCT